MESNRDEALRCARLAEKYAANGERDRAERFAAKSIRLFPNDRAKGEFSCLIEMMLCLKKHVIGFFQIYWNGLLPCPHPRQRHPHPLRPRPRFRPQKALLRNEGLLQVEAQIAAVITRLAQLKKRRKARPMAALEITQPNK